MTEMVVGQPFLTLTGAALILDETLGAKNILCCRRHHDARNRYAHDHQTMINMAVKSKIEPIQTLSSRRKPRCHLFPESPMSFYEKLKALNIELPAVATPAAAYVMYAQTGNTVFLSGHIAKKDGKPWVGQLGKNMTTEQGKQAARAVAVDLLATLQAACGGDLNRVTRIVKVMSLVNSTGDFTEQHLVTNGASELFGEVFGEQGKHARSAFGVAQIPMGACVEIELIAEIA
jgi:enamine deaminase RidA (YjgF/YER057c/UK114 family)